MNHKAVQLILASQLVFMGSLLVCLLIDPHIIRNNWALSLYGTQVSTFLPFAVGVLLPSYLLYKASFRLNKQRPVNQKLSKILVLLAVLPLGIAITPIRAGENVWVFHAIFSVAWFLIQLGAGFWLVSQTKDLVSVLILGILVVSQVLVCLSLEEFDVLNVIAAAQIVAVTSFSVLLMRTVVKIEHYPLKLLTEDS